mgnify:FL=1
MEVFEEDCEVLEGCWLDGALVCIVELDARLDNDPVLLADLLGTT